MVNKALAKAIKAGAKEKFIYLKSTYNELKDNPQIDPNSLKSLRAQIDITAGIWNHDKALFDKGMWNYRKTMVVPPSPASSCEVTLYKDDYVNDHGDEVTRTREVVQTTDSAEQANTRNKQNRNMYENMYKKLGKSWWKKGGKKDRA